MMLTKELADQLFREQILQARRMTPDERVREGLRLSDLAVRVMADGVRHQFPAAPEEELRRLLRERIERVRRLKEMR